nr:hypothetical protein [uncultured Cellulosilyticum sp.]
MDIKELDRKAKINEPLPRCLAGYEQAYYLASRSLYKQYEDKLISLEQARYEKEKILEQYHDGRKQYELFMSLFEIEDKLKKLKEQGFNTVLEWEILELLEIAFK